MGLRGAARGCMGLHGPAWGCIGLYRSHLWVTDQRLMPPLHCARPLSAASKAHIGMDS